MFLARLGDQRSQDWSNSIPALVCRWPGGPIGGTRIQAKFRRNRNNLGPDGILNSHTDHPLRVAYQLQPHDFTLTTSDTKPHTGGPSDTNHDECLPFRYRTVGISLFGIERD